MSGLQRISADGGSPAVLTRPDRARGENNHSWPDPPPGGEAVPCTVGGPAICGFRPPAQPINDRAAGLQPRAYMASRHCPASARVENGFAAVFCADPFLDRPSLSRLLPVT